MVFRHAPIPPKGSGNNNNNYFILFYLPYLSSIHEKANCIAIFWTGRPHPLGSCHFQGVWATCLPHKGGGVPLRDLPKDTRSELAGLFYATFPKCRAPRRKAMDTIFWSLLVWLDKGLNPRSTDCEADALVTTPLGQQQQNWNYRGTIT